jgi:acyl-CoA oxidase
MPGVTGGDIGPKIGFNNKNNGWTQFNKVRIPRENLLMRFVSVDKQGNFSL